MSEQPVQDADVAYTDPRVTEAIVRYLVTEHRLASARTIWEPFAGSGTFVTPILNQTPAMVLCHELDPAAPIHTSPMVDQKRCWAVLGSAWERDRPVEWAVTNPPFSLLDETIKLLSQRCSAGFALLMIGQALTPGGRDWIWDSCRPVETIRLTPRCAFARPRAEAKIKDAVAKVTAMTAAGASVPTDLLNLSKKKYNPKATDMREYSVAVWQPPFHSPTVRDRRLNWKSGQVWG
jgi:hypothetical protein